MSDLEEWGESHGYVSYRCPVCGRHFSTDGDPAQECCPLERDEEQETDEEEAEEWSE